MLSDNLCKGCFSEKGNLEECPHCHFQEDGTQEVQEASLFLATGTILADKYIIGNVLGQGGFGITYISWDINLNIKLAIKEFFPQGMVSRIPGQSQVVSYKGADKEQYEFGLDRFLKEARTLAQFENHPNIVSIRDFFKANGTAYMIMSYVEGMTFEKYLIQQGGVIDFNKALDVMMPVMDALKEVHAVGIMHRDISPDNILIDKMGRVIIIDFGAARQEVKEKSKSLSVILKAGYAPEEQYRSKGKQGPWTDVYAVAVTMYRAITGITPPESMDRLVEDTILYPSELGIIINKRLEKTLLKGMGVHSKDRYQSISDFQQDLINKQEEKFVLNELEKIGDAAISADNSLARKISNIDEHPKKYPQRKKSKINRTYNTVYIPLLTILFVLGGYYLYQIWQSANTNNGSNREKVLITEEGATDESIIPIAVAFDDSGIVEPIISIEDTKSDHSSDERYYRILNADINYEIRENGLIEARESRNYFFSGSFTGLYQRFPKKGGINYINIAVEENGNYFDFNPGTTYGPTGTFYIEEDTDSILVDWSIEAKDEEKNFVLHYEILNALKLQNDQAELYWQFIGDEWSVPTEKVFIKLIIPEGASIQEIEAFGYGPSHGVVSIISSNVITWEVDYLPERTFLEGRVIFPARLLKGAN